MSNILHLLTNNSVPTCIPSLDTVVLMQDAAYLVLKDIDCKSLYVVKNDLLARGLSNNNNNCAKVIDYDELTALTSEYKKVITWT